MGATQEINKQRACSSGNSKGHDENTAGGPNSKGPRNDFGLLVREGFFEEVTWQQRSESEGSLYWAERQLGASSVSSRRARG